jgi:hypothetical protein
MNFLCHADFWLERLPQLLDLPAPLKASTMAGGPLCGEDAFGGDHATQVFRRAVPKLPSRQANPKSDVLRQTDTN